ncbi:MAG: S1 RNA-binding domain-containing protein, partial [Oscillospiraceae bacterium]
NTVEGLVHISTLPEGSYEFDGLITLRDALSNRQFRVGDAVKVTCTKADVSCGNIDFSLAE